MCVGVGVGVGVSVSVSVSVCVRVRVRVCVRVCAGGVMVLGAAMHADCFTCGGCRYFFPPGLCGNERFDCFGAGHSNFAALLLLCYCFATALLPLSHVDYCA
jgi:ribosomal protein S27AE